MFSDALHRSRRVTLALVIMALAACDRADIQGGGATPPPSNPAQNQGKKLTLAEALGEIEPVTEITESKTANPRMNDGLMHSIFLGGRISGDGHMLVYVPPLSSPNAKYQVWARDLDNPDSEPMLVSSLDGTAATANDDHMGHPGVNFAGTVAFFAGYASNLGGAANKRAIYMKDLTDITKPPKVISKLGNTIADCEYIFIAPSGKRLFAQCQAPNFPDEVASNPIYRLYSFDLTVADPKPEHIALPNYPDGTWILSPANTSIDGSHLLIEALKLGYLGAPQASTIFVYDLAAKTAVNMSSYFPAGMVCASSWLSPDATYVLTACKGSDARYKIFKIDMTTKTVTQPFADLTTKLNITSVGNRFFTDPSKIWTAGSFRRDGLIDLLYLGYKVDAFDASGNKIEKNEYFYLNSPTGTDLGNLDERCDWMEPSSDLSRFVFSCLNVKDNKRQLYRRGHFGDQPAP